MTFTKDGELVCRHAECDLQTTTNIVATDLNNSRGTLLTLRESIALNRKLGVKHTPELKEGDAQRPAGRLPRRHRSHGEHAAAAHLAGRAA